jgi:drug/metabolite transporter (DMT)-like permease
MSRRGWVLFVALSLIWGVPYLLLKVAVEDLSPAVVVLLRTALAAAMLLPVALLRGELAPVLRRWRWVLVFAAVEIAVPFWLLGAAEQHLSSSLTGLLVACVPLLGVLVARLARLEDRVDRGRLTGLLVGLAGVGLLVGLDLRGGDLLAALAVVTAALGYAVGPVIAATRLDGLPGTGLSAVALAVAAVVWAPIAWVQRPVDPAAVPAVAWQAVVLLGAVCTAVAFLVFFALVAEVGPGRATVITYLNPAVALVLGVLVLDEPLTGGIVAGSVLVLLGSYLATRRSAGQAPAVDGGGVGGADGADTGVLPPGSSSVSTGGSPTSRAASSGTSS